MTDLGSGPFTSNGEDVSEIFFNLTSYPEKDLNERNVLRRKLIVIRNA